MRLLAYADPYQETRDSGQSSGFSRHSERCFSERFGPECPGGRLKTCTAPTAKGPLGRRSRPPGAQPLRSPQVAQIVACLAGLSGQKKRLQAAKLVLRLATSC